jgi:hypothetical protein
MSNKNTKSLEKNQFMASLGITTEALNEKYLGLPMYMGRSKKRIFEYLKERVWKRLQGWKEKLLSKAGKEVLIEAVVQAIPSYAMSCFDLTRTPCDEIINMVGRFWWAQQEKGKQNALAILRFTLS